MEPRATMVRPPVAPRLLRTRRFVAVELDAYSQLTLRRIERLTRDHVAGAPPFRGLLTAHFLRHFQQHFHDFDPAKG